MDERNDGVVTGEGWAVSSLDALGEGPGFRKIRGPLGVTAFGVNAVVLPPGYQGNEHYHERQEETYFVHRGRLDMEFGDGTVQVLEPGGIARVDAATVRRVRNTGEEDVVYVCVGGADGYVPRDGVVPRGDAGLAGPVGG